MIPEGWCEVRIEELAAQQKHAIVDGPFGSNLKSEHYRSSGIPVIQSGFVTSGKFIADEYYYVDETLFRQQIRSRVIPGDIIVAKIGAKCGTCAILPSKHPESILAGNCLKITTDPEKCYNEFLLHMLQFLYAQTQLKEVKTVTAQPAISLKSLKSLQILLPPLTEQLKIATILGAWDRAIDLTARRIEAAQQRKRALMQRLLTGQWRFREFEGQEWREVKIADIAVINPPKPGLTDDRLVSFVTMSNISENAKIVSASARPYREVKSGFTSFQNGDVIVAKITPCFENGKGALVANLEHQFGFGSTEFYTLRADPQEVLPSILYYHTTSYPFRKNGEANMAGSAGQRRVRKEYIAEYKILLPLLAEQRRIAAVLDAADREIDLLARKRAALERQKQGLMQQLLTGQVRV